MASKSITSAPKLTRVSAGVYRDSSGKTVRSTTGKASSSAKKTSSKGLTSAPEGSYQYANDPYMSANQNAILNSTEQGDIGLSNAANGYLGKIQNMGDFNYTGPAQGVTSPEEMQRIEKSVYDDFQRRDAPQRQQEADDLARWGQMTGNSVDSPAYQAKATQLAQAQNDRQAGAQAQATQLGGQRAQQLFDQQNTAHQLAYGEQEANYTRPLSTFAGIRGAMGPSAGQGQQFSYQSRLADQAGGITRENAKYAAGLTPRGGGGGGGGGRSSGGRRSSGGSRSLVSAPQTMLPTQTVQPAAAAQQPSALSTIGGALLKPVVNSLGTSLGEWAGNGISNWYNGRDWSYVAPDGSRENPF